MVRRVAAMLLSDTPFLRKCIHPALRWPGRKGALAGASLMTVLAFAARISSGVARCVLDRLEMVADSSCEGSAVARDRRLWKMPHYCWIKHGGRVVLWAAQDAGVFVISRTCTGCGSCER